MNIPTQSSFQTKSQRFGKGSVIVRARDNFLSDDDIQRAAPSIFAGEAHSSRSEKFHFHSTRELLANMRVEGFFPTEVRQGGSKDLDKRSFTKHLIRFRRDNALRLNDNLQEVVLVGAHDGTSSTHLMGGWFRLICLNGMVVSDGPQSTVRVPHFARSGWDKVIEGSYTVINDGQRQAAQIEQMRAVSLSTDDQERFARQALVARYGEDAPDVPAHRLLEARRPEDRGDSLWLTMNRVQENLMRGGVGYRGEREVQGRVRMIHAHTRPVNSIDGTVDVNRALWSLAETRLAA